MANGLLSATCQTVRRDGGRSPLREREFVVQQILSVWSSLDMKRRVIVVAATAAMFLAVLGLSRLATAPSMTLLYSGLEPSAAGEVVSALEQRGVTYEIRGSSIFVEDTRRDELRMTLAGEGLPANGAQGYELLDSLSGFGTTSQMFDAAYWRAKEGELARTIVASPNVKAARVHIAAPGSTPFRRQTDPTASVTVTPAGGKLTPEHAKALKYLVASAVAGLAIENVSVIDGRNGVVVTSDDDSIPAAAADREADMEHNVERLLEARVGPGNAVVEVAIATVTEREQIVERRFDPDGRVAISTETEERTSTSNDTAKGVTVASNLPDGDAGANGNQSSSQNAETRERTNFEVSETQREILRTPGSVKRVSVAVLVDGIRTVTPAGQTEWQPRPEEEIAALRELVASAVGYDEARGDTITIKSMEFLPQGTEGTMVTSALSERIALDVMSLIQLAVLAVVVLALGLFVVRPILANRREEAARLAAPEPAETVDEEFDELPALPALEGFDTEGGFGGMNVVNDIDLEGSGLPVGDTSDAVARLRRLIEERQEETVGVLRSWMEQREEKA